MDCFKYGVLFVSKCLDIDTYYNISIQYQPFNSIELIDPILT